jgi:hypothetical protein
VLRRAVTSVLLVMGLTIPAALSAPSLASASAEWRFGPLPLAADTADFGSCGDTWASADISGDLAVSRNRDGTFRVTATFVGSRFVTVAGPSPNACDPVTGNGGTGYIGAGVTGSIGGRVSSTVSDMFRPSRCANGACATYPDWFYQTFGAQATIVSIDDVSLWYAADPGQGLALAHWHIEPPARGGNRGDIRSGP